MEKKKKIPSDNQIISKDIFSKNFHALDKAFNTTNHIKSSLKIYFGNRTYASLKKLKSSQKEIKELNGSSNNISLAQISADILNESVLDLFAKAEDTHYGNILKYQENKKYNSKFCNLYDYLVKRRDRKIINNKSCFNQLINNYYKRGIKINGKFLEKISNLYDKSPINTFDEHDYENLFLFNYNKYLEQIQSDEISNQNLIKVNKSYENNLNNNLDEKKKFLPKSRNENKIEFKKLRQVKFSKKLFKLTEKQYKLVDNLTKQYLRDEGLEYQAISSVKKNDIKQKVINKIKNSNSQTILIPGTIDLTPSEKLKIEINIKKDKDEIKKIKETIKSFKDESDYNNILFYNKNKRSVIKPYSSYSFRQNKIISNLNNKLNQSSSNFFKKGNNDSSINESEHSSTIFGFGSDKSIYLSSLKIKKEPKRLISNSYRPLMKIKTSNDFNKTMNLSRINYDNYDRKKKKKYTKDFLISSSKKSKSLKGSLNSFDVKNLNCEILYNLLKKMNQQNKMETMNKVKDYFKSVGFNFDKIQKSCNKNELYTFFNKLKSIIIKYNINNHIKSLNSLINRHSTKYMHDCLDSIEKLDRKLGEFQDLFYLALLREQS